MRRPEAGDEVLTPDSVVATVTGDRDPLFNYVDVEIGDFVQTYHIEDVQIIKN